ncbi:MAG TPA: toll/interleukin-1 receptor domain-containing protein [Steroidobacteraceae bacterium]|jgi:tetratricopeptide (TPR) repeat protein|nr:toll/interleukin-1 receptor domain-containing protein [Steroidobacteraceae bacterium]
MEAPKYRAFISYSHRDAGWASWLHGSLERYHPPKALIGTVTARGPVPKRLAPVFRDRDELPSATNLGTLINAALSGSACQIVICSPRSAKSKWVNEEILEFKRLGREDRIFCLIVDGEPNATDLPGREAEECFPPALRFHVGRNGELTTARTEPIAADARPGKDGKSNARLKLISGLLGVGFDTLKRREQARRTRRLFAVACAALAGMVLTSGLAAYALVQRAAAQRQTVRAEAESETTRQAINFLVDLFKVSDPSEARGNTVTAREMLDKGAARINTELARQPGIQATLKDTLGTVYMGLGLYAQARPLLDGALATRRQPGAAEPAALSDTLTHQGELLRWQGDLAGATQDYRDALQLLAKEPDSRRKQEAVAQAQYGLGVALESEGRGTEAQASLSSALARQRALYGEANGDTATTLKELAVVVDQNGDLKKAIPLMKEAVAIQRRLQGAAPHPALAEALSDLALLLQENDQRDEAEQLYLEALAMLHKLYGEKHASIAMELNNLALLYFTKGDLDRSESTYHDAYMMQRELLGENHSDVAFTLGKIAFVQYEKGHTQQGIATLQESLHLYQRVFTGDHPEVARTMNRLGFWQILNGEYAAAEGEIQTALAMRRRLFNAKHPDIASSLMHLAILEVATGKFAEAQRDALQAREIYAAAWSPTHWTTAVATSAEGAALTGLGDYGRAEKLLNEGNAIVSKDPDALAAYRKLVRGYLMNLRREEQRHAYASGNSVRATPGYPQAAAALATAVPTTVAVAPK